MWEELQRIVAEAKEEFGKITNTRNLVYTLIQTVNKGVALVNNSPHRTVPGRVVRIGVTTLNPYGILSPIHMVKGKKLKKGMFLDTFLHLPLSQTSLQPLMDRMEGDFINDMEAHMHKRIASGHPSICSQICLSEGIQANMRFPYKTERVSGFVFISGDAKGMFSEEILKFTSQLIPAFETSLQVCNDLEAIIEARDEMAQEDSSVDRLDLLNKIQKKLEPEEAPHFLAGSPVEIFHRCLPWEGHPSGDLLNIWKTKDGAYVVLIADVVGHGKTAALITIFLRGLFLKESEKSRSPREVMARVNEQLIEFLENNFEDSDELFATTLFGFFRPSTYSFTYTNAGHPSPFCGGVKEGPMEKRQFDSTNMPLGVPFEQDFYEKTIELSGEVLLAFYTDGILEANNPQEEPFGKERLHNLFEKSFEKPVEETGEEVFRALDSHREGRPFEDDLTLLLMKISTGRP